MQLIPITPVPSPTFNILLGGQNCKINLYQKTTGMYLDLFVNDAPIVQTAACLDRVRIVREAYLGFIGDLVFCDLQGADDPTYDGLGTRYVLGYASPGELPA